MTVAPVRLFHGCFYQEGVFRDAPRFEPNPNAGEPWRPGGGSPPVAARQTIFVGGGEASHITMPTIRDRSG